MRTSSRSFSTWAGAIDVLPQPAAASAGNSAGPDLSVFDTPQGRALLAALHTLGPFQNRLDPVDVNNDSHTTSIDALLVINVLNGAAPSTVFLDVNGDQEVTPLDALRVINVLNRHGGDEADAEGEQTAVIPAFPPIAFTAADMSAESPPVRRFPTRSDDRFEAWEQAATDVASLFANEPSPSSSASDAWYTPKTLGADQPADDHDVLDGGHEAIAEELVDLLARAAL